MIKKITSDDFRTNTREVLDGIELKCEQYVIYRYKRPAALLISLKDAEKYGICINNFSNSVNKTCRKKLESL